MSVLGQSFVDFRAIVRGENDCFQTWDSSRIHFTFGLAKSCTSTTKGKTSLQWDREAQQQQEPQRLVLLMGEMPVTPTVLWFSLLPFITPGVLFSVQDAADFHGHYSSLAGPSGSPVKSFWSNEGRVGFLQGRGQSHRGNSLTYILLQPATDEKRNKPKGIRVFLFAVHSLCALHISYRSRVFLGICLFSCQEHP